MNNIVKMDLFFFITSVAIVIITLVFSVALYYIIRILRDIKYISKKAREESDLIAEDLSGLRQNIKQGGAKLKFLASFFNSIYKKHKAGKN